MWQKERIINQIVLRLPSEYDTIAWVDADLILMNNDWIDQTERVLNKSRVCQLFGRFVRTDSLGTIDHQSAGMIAAPTGGVTNPGGAWVARRELFTEGGGLYERDIVGGGDSAAAMTWLGRSWGAAESRVNPDYRDDYLRWSSASHRWVQGRVGYTPGDAMHLYHGSRQNRQYVSRVEILRRHHYSPDRDLDNSQPGPLVWSQHAPAGLRSDVRTYFENRRDDE